MRKRLVLFLVRRRLGLKKYQKFRFANQSSPTDYYYFTSSYIFKCHASTVERSSVSLNWLLDDNCEIIKFA